jgi:hypothetical protein
MVEFEVSDFIKKQKQFNDDIRKELKDNIERITDEINLIKERITWMQHRRIDDNKK